ncbi:MAG: hypothetical protein JWQ45_3435 [Blastococcus sp.]|nr:hypothetical protein [Blastococcus sp.]
MPAATAAVAARPAAPVGRVPRAGPPRDRAAALHPAAPADGVLLRLSDRDDGDLRISSRRRRATRRDPVPAVPPGRHRGHRDHAEQLPGIGDGDRRRTGGAVSWSGCSRWAPRRSSTSPARPGRSSSPTRRSWRCCCLWPGWPRRPYAARPGALADLRLGRGAGGAGRDGAGHRGIRAAGQRDVRVHRGVGLRGGAPVLLRDLLRSRRDTGVDAAGRRLPAAEWWASTRMRRPVWGWRGCAAGRRRSAARWTWRRSRGRARR